MRVVGHVLRARARFLQRYEAADLEPLWAAVDPATREVFDSGVIETRWYPVEVFYDLVESADRILGDGDLKLVEEMGAFAAEINVTGPLRGLIFKFGSPRFGLKWTPRAWSSQFDSGAMRTLVVESNRARICLGGIPGGTPPSMVAGIRGWLKTAVRLFGAELLEFAIEHDDPEVGDTTFACAWR